MAINSAVQTKNKDTPTLGELFFFDLAKDPLLHKLMNYRLGFV